MKAETRSKNTIFIQISSWLYPHKQQKRRKRIGWKRLSSDGSTSEIRT